VSETPKQPPTGGARAADFAEYPVQIGPVRFANPYFAASGCFGYGLEYAAFIPPYELGAVVTKTITLEPRAGNPLPRLRETPAGLLNSIGLQNVGLEAYLRDKLPALVEAGGMPFVSIAATEQTEYERMAERLAAHSAVRAVEINLGCPNVDAGGDRDAAEARAVERITRAVRERLPGRCVAVKLTPNVTDITNLARGAEQGGADAVTAIKPARVTSHAAVFLFIVMAMVSHIEWCTRSPALDRRPSRCRHPVQRSAGWARSRSRPARCRRCVPAG
jgi:dihydroorotate dehydrogenase (NAD+) catalytic subunit